MCKGEIAHYEQFLLFPQCFLKACFPGASTGIIVWEWVKSLPHSQILDLSKLRAFADDNLNVNQKLKFVFGRVENIVVKGENADYQHFFLFPECFLKGSLYRVVNCHDCVVN